MDLFKLFTLISAASAGATMGSYLLVVLLYNALLRQPKNLTDSLYIYRRLYRLNSLLCLFGGVSAALLNNRPAAFMLAILAASYIFNHAHILKGLSRACDARLFIVNTRNYRSLSTLQNLMHFFQFVGAAYVIYLLAIASH
jgi:hypothetical protein